MAANPVFFDHNSSTPVSARVERKMLDVLHRIYGNPHSKTHIHGWNASKLIDDISTDISAHFSGLKVIFTSGATEANNLAFNLHPKNKKRDVAIGPLEHSAVHEPAARLARKLGGKLITIPCDPEGRIDLKFVSDEMLDTCALISVAFASGETGTVQTELQRLQEQAKIKGALFHSDMSQALQHPLARQFGAECDAISISSHKIFGPQGVGAFLANEAYLEAVEPMLLGGGQQEGYRAGTIPTFLCAGLGEAIAETFEWVDSGGNVELEEKIQYFFKLLEETIGEKYEDSLEIVGSRLFSNRTPGNLTLVLPQGLDASDLLLASAAIFSASQGSACHSGQESASSSLRALGLSDHTARRVLRFGLGRTTTTNDINTVVKAIGEKI